MSEKNTALSAEKSSLDKVANNTAALNEGFSKSKRMLIEKRLRSAAKSDRVKCADALAIADSLGFDVSSREVGKIANEIGIKVTACQLDCF